MIFYDYSNLNIMKPTIIGHDADIRALRFSPSYRYGFASSFRFDMTTWLMLSAFTKHLSVSAANGKLTILLCHHERKFGNDFSRNSRHCILESSQGPWVVQTSDQGE
jgi:WD40 repeat protein